MDKEVSGGIEEERQSCLLKGVVWNMNGCKPDGQGKRKIRQLRNTVTKEQPDVILIQETHMSEQEEFWLRTELPEYVWICSQSGDGTAGVATGVYKTEELEILRTWDTTSAHLAMAEVRRRGTTYLVVNIYAKCVRPRETVQEMRQLLALSPASEEGSKNMIIAGDWNVDFGRDDYKKEDRRAFEEWMEEQEVTLIENRIPTHANGGVIDQVATSDMMGDNRQRYLRVKFNQLGDHNLLVFGMVQRRTERRQESWKKNRVPSWMFRNLGFVAQLRGRLMQVNVEGSPFKVLEKTHRVARQLQKEFLRTRTMDEKVEPWRQLTRWVAMLGKVRKLNKKTDEEELTRIEENMAEQQRREEEISEPEGIGEELWEVTEEGMVAGWKERKKTATERCIRRVTGLAAMCNVALGDLGLETSRPKWQTLLPKKFTALAGVLRRDTGEVSSEPKHIAQELARFWRETYSERVVDASKTEELLREYKKEMDWSPVPSLAEFMENSRRGLDTSSSPGPDGMPYQFYTKTWRQTGPILYRIMREMCLSEGQKKYAQPNNFNHALGFFPPKTEGTTEPASTRPISVGNTSYRLIMRCVAQVARRISGKILDQDQYGAAGKSMMNCADEVLVDWYQHLGAGRKRYFVQTDYRKAFDFICRDVIFEILPRMGCPEWIMEIVRAEK